VNELEMALVRRVFRMVGVEGMSLNAVGKRLEAEGIPAPRGGRTWNRPTLRKVILSDVYLRHGYEEVSRILIGEVAATLDPSAHYDISWYGKQRHTHHHDVRIKNGKRPIQGSRRVWTCHRKSGLVCRFPTQASGGMGACRQRRYQR
jgi:hypothetical protein